MAFTNTKSHFAVLLPILLSCFFLQLNNVKSSNSISFDYTHFELGFQDLIFQGRATTRSGILILNLFNPSGGPPEKNTAGRALFSSPVQLWERSTGRAASFSTSFTFDLFYSDTIADGLTFFIAPVDTDIPIDGTGGNLGLYGTDAKPFIAVEFDTYQNDWDPTAPHIGVDINSVSSVITSNWNTTGKSGRALATINYDAASANLSVFVTYPENPNSGESTLSYNIALKDYLPEWVRVGFSGSTGEVVEFNEVFSWSFSSNLVNIDDDNKKVM